LNIYCNPGASQILADIAGVHKYIRTYHLIKNKGESQKPQDSLKVASETKKREKLMNKYFFIHVINKFLNTLMGNHPIILN